MKARLRALDHLAGDFELPDNWDLSTDIHLPFSKEDVRIVRGATGEIDRSVALPFKRAIFRWSGTYDVNLLPTFDLIDLQ